MGIIVAIVVIVGLIRLIKVICGYYKKLQTLKFEIESLGYEISEDYQIYHNDELANLPAFKLQNLVLQDIDSFMKEMDKCAEEINYGMEWLNKCRNWLVKETESCEFHLADDKYRLMMMGLVSLKIDIVRSARLVANYTDSLKQMDPNGLYYQGINTVVTAINKFQNWLLWEYLLTVSNWEIPSYLNISEYTLRYVEKGEPVPCCLEYIAKPVPLFNETTVKEIAVNGLYRKVPEGMHFKLRNLRSG